MGDVFHQHFFDLGLISSRLAASKNLSNPENAREYEKLRNILSSLKIAAPSQGEYFNTSDWADQFAPPNSKLKKALFRLGAVSFALFMIGKKGHPDGEAEFLSHFDVINLKKSIGENFIKNLRNMSKREAFNLYINQIGREIECLDVTVVNSESSEPLLDPEDLLLSATIEDFRKQFKELHIQDWYFPDIDNDLREIATCLENKCYRAALSLARRVLEFSLKLYCKNRSIDITNVWNFDKLLDRIDSSDLHIDSSLKKIWHAINQQRIIDADSESLDPPPSKSQATMVCQSLIDTIKEVFIEGNSWHCCPS